MKRMDRHKLNIGAYYLKPYACTEAHVKDVKECGVDFIVSMQNVKEHLDLLHKYGIGAIVNGVVPGWWGGDGSNAGKMAERNPLERYFEAAKNFTDHPAIWGIDCGDEPSALDFPHYGNVLETVSELFPNQFPYLNLYPNYASVAQNNAEQTVNQLGTATYEEHIKRYCECVGSDYICYDFYLYAISVAKAFENLVTVSDACLRSGRSMWIVLQVNSNDPAKTISEQQLRFQAYTAMAFGCENIIWGCYTAGWWHNQVLDGEGNKTCQYERLKKVNAEIKAIAPEYMSLRRVDSHFIGFPKDSEYLDLVKENISEELNTGRFISLSSELPLVVGEMVSRSDDGKAGVFVCAADDPYGASVKTGKISFKTRGNEVYVISPEGKKTLKKDENGSYTAEIRSNEGLLIVTK